MSEVGPAAHGPAGRRITTVSTIICVGDIHVTDRPPANATESYTDDILTMLRWVADYAASVKADAVVWAGDVFHHKAPARTSHALVLKMLDVVRYHAAVGVPLWCVTGNHDVTNDVLDTVRDRQPLGVLYAAGLGELNGWHPTLPLYGVPWRGTWTEPGDAAAALEGWRAEDSERDPSRSLVVTHAPIYPPPQDQNQMFELVPTAGPEGLSAAMGNRGFLYYGHIHEDHGIFEVEGVTYANMGAISRGSLHEYNLERSIKVAQWTDGNWPRFGDRYPARFTEVPVPHKPASEAFRLAEAVEEKAERLSLESFLADVGSRRLDIASAGSMIEHIRTRTEVPEPIRKRAITILEELS